MLECLFLYLHYTIILLNVNETRLYSKTITNQRYRYKAYPLPSLWDERCVYTFMVASSHAR